MYQSFSILVLCLAGLTHVGPASGSSHMSSSSSKLHKRLASDSYSRNNGHSQNSGMAPICESYENLHPEAQSCQEYISSPSCNEDGAYNRLQSYAGSLSSRVSPYKSCPDCSPGHEDPSFGRYHDAVGNVFTDTQDVFQALHKRYPDMDASSRFKPAFDSIRLSLHVVITLAISLKVDVHLLFINLDINLDLFLNLGIDLQAILSSVLATVLGLVGGVLSGVPLLGL